jgi:hypothetical protein
MDTELTQEGIAPPGATVSPALRTFTEPALALEEQREVTESFTIRCLEASHHIFTFTNTIAPLHPEDTDPDLSNNSKSVVLDIECVVPVAINIHPHSYPNAIRPGNGVIPVAVLTTAAGEYGLPLAFDATTIDPLTVRFAPRPEAWAGGGAAEAHDRGHIQDSYELDEATRDGDPDMVLHFVAQDASMVPGVTEGCVKGEWTDANGVQHKFFGCDSVRMVPPNS